MRTTRLAVIGALSSLAACGGGGGGSRPPPVVTSPPAAPVLTLSLDAVKIFSFSWTAAAGATSYKLLENADGLSGYTAVPTGVLTATSYQHVVPLFERLNARYLVQACNSAGCTDSAPVSVSRPLIEAIGYGKASNTDAGDRFGYGVALSGDGRTLAVGAPFESSSSNGIGGDEANNLEGSAGAVYVFTLGGGIWTKQAYVKAAVSDPEDQFGLALALSADGNTLAVGAYAEDGGGTGVGANPASNSRTQSGAAYVFSRAGTQWRQQAYIKASNTGAFDLFGFALALSGDGHTLAVGAKEEASNARGIDGDATSDAYPGAGAVYVYASNGDAWTFQAYVKASNTDARDEFGMSLALSGDGGTLAVGASGEASNGVGVDANQSNNSAQAAGAVYVFVRSPAGWAQQSYLKASNARAEAGFGTRVALDASGDTLAVGSPAESSNAVGVGGDQSNTTKPLVGAAYVFTRVSGAWSQQAYLKPGYAVIQYFGSSLALSADGNVLAAGGYFEPGNAAGAGAEPLDFTSEGAGAVHTYRRSSGGSWSYGAYLKAPNAMPDFLFGWSVALAGDGNTLVVGSPTEDSGAFGFGGDASDHHAPEAGAIYIY